MLYHCRGKSSGVFYIAGMDLSPPRITGRLIRHMRGYTFSHRLMKVLTFKSAGVQTQASRATTQPGFASHVLENDFTGASGIPGESDGDLVKPKSRLDCGLPGLGLGQGLSVTVVRLLQKPHVFIT